MISRRMAGWPTCVLVLVVAAGSSAVQAADVGYHVSVGLGYSDNIARLPEHEESETIGSLGLDFSILQRSRKLDLQATADLSWLKYFGDTYDSELVGTFTGEGTYEIVSEHLAWVAQDNFGQVRIDPFSALTPDNLENINYFTTGPDLTFGMGKDTRLRLSGRFSDIAYEESPFDSTRLSGIARLMHAFSSATTVSLNAQRDHIDFDEAPDDLDYDRDQAFLRYEATGSRTQLAVDLGYSRLLQGDETTDGLMMRLEASRNVSASSTVLLTAGREFLDAGDSFRLEQGLPSGGLEARPSTQTPNPFTSTYASLGWQFHRNRTGLTFDVTHFDDAYETASALDRTRMLASLGLTREITPAMRLYLGGTYAQEDFDTAIGDYHETGGMLGLTHRLGRNLTVGARYNHLRRKGDVPVGAISENRFWLSLSYGRDAPQAALAPRIQ